MHRIRFRLWLRPTPRWGSLQRCPDPVAGFNIVGPSSKERGGEGTEGEEGRERKEREWDGLKPVYFLFTSLHSAVSPTTVYDPTEWFTDMDNLSN